MKKAVVFVLIVCMSILSASYAVKFNDIDNTHWAFDAVQKMKQDGVLKGYDDGSFKPNKQITRAEFAKIFLESLNIENDEVDTEEFEDVDSSHWAYDYIKSFSSYITIEENEEGELLFYPDKVITRQEVAEAIVNATCGERSASIEYAEDFDDFEDIDERYLNAVCLAVKYGFMNGNDDNTFKPNGGLTRAQVAQIMVNVSGVISKVSASNNDAEYEIALTDEEIDSYVEIYEWDEDEIVADIKIEDNFEDFVDETFDASNEDNEFSVSSKKHSHNYKLQTTVKPTCKATGYKLFRCSCGATKKTTLAKTSHKFGAWKTTKPATCGSKGQKVKTCSICGTTKVENIKITGKHKWIASSVKPATCTTAGTTSFRCSKCGSTKTSTTKALGHSYKNNVCIRCQTVNPNFFQAISFTPNVSTSSNLFNCEKITFKASRAFSGSEWIKVYVNGKCDNSNLIYTPSKGEKQFTMNLLNDVRLFNTGKNTIEIFLVKVNPTDAYRNVEKSVGKFEYNYSPKPIVEEEYFFEEPFTEPHDYEEEFYEEDFLTGEPIFFEEPIFEDDIWDDYVEDEFFIEEDFIPDGVVLFE